MNNHGADIAFGGIRAQMLSSRHSFHVKSFCKNSPGLKKDYFLYQTGGRPPLLVQRRYLHA